MTYNFVKVTKINLVYKYKLNTVHTTLETSFK